MKEILLFDVLKKFSFEYWWIILLIIISLFFSFMPSIEFLLNFANDDSFFYIKTSYNFSIGAGSTFDLVNMTNGYHPLWFLILSCYFFIINLFTDFSPELYYRYAVFLICLVGIFNLIALRKYFEKTDPGLFKKQFMLITPLFLTFVFIRDHGMETHITCLLLTLYLLVKSTELSANEDHLKLKCLLIVLLYLARIDFLFTVIPFVIAADIFTMPKNARKKFIVYFSLSLIFIVILYSGSNYFFFGEISPVTSKIKNSFPEILFFFNIERLVDPGSFTNQFIKVVYTILVIMAFLILFSFKKYRIKLKKIDLFLFVLCLSALFYIIINLFFNTYSLKEWYVAFPAFVSSMLAVRLIILFPVFYKPALVTFVSIFVIYFAVTRIQNPKWNSMYYYALELKKNTDTEDRIFMIDLSGIVGYFSERKVINGDGLANSYEYWNYKTSNKLDEYFRIKHIKYYSSYSTRKGNHRLDEKLGYYNDEHYSSVFGGYSFNFPAESLVLKIPYYYSHAVNSDIGFWYLFKLK
ncbi:MAG: hypothetical protein ABIO41_02400 [Ignavibacteria bacterium]